MADLKSRIILASGIKMDRDYRNVLSYTEDEMVSLCESNKVAEASNYSFLRSNQNLYVDFSYETCLKANYVAFQNPDYSNKWFFAWIDEVNYRGDNNTEIVYTIDSWSTWFDYWTAKPCFIVREHVNNDAIGANLVPENLDTGECVQVGHMEEDTSLSDFSWVAIMSSWDVKKKKQFQGISIINGNIFGTKVYLVKTEPASNLENLMKFLFVTNADGHIDDVNDIFIIPSILVDESKITEVLFDYPDGSQGRVYEMPWSTAPAKIEVTTEKRYSFRGYTPKNNKCFIYPYNYLFVSNNSGNNNIYRYEDFYNDDDLCHFNVQVCFGIGASGRAVPRKYRGAGLNDDESLPLAKYPVCGWSVDSYTNWLTQNAINIPTQILSNVLGAGQNIISSSAPQTPAKTIIGQGQQNLASTSNIVGQVGSVATNVASSLGQFYSASLMPNIQGGGNTGDVNYAMKRNTFSIRHMQCKTEFIKIIDDYFSRFGYKLNTVETPNITGRQNFNYVEIGSSEEIGYGKVPAVHMQNINNACRTGVTIWHSHSNLGNYNVSNNIV